MARRNIQDCVRAIKQANKTKELTDKEAEQLLDRISQLAAQRQKKKLINLDQALREIEGEIILANRTIAAIDYRNKLLAVAAKKKVMGFVRRFPTLGEGLRAYMEGSVKDIDGARNSVDYQAKALHGKYFGRLVADLEAAGVFSDFRKGALEREIYIELGELGVEGGKPGRSGSPKAMAIAKAIHDVTDELVSRQNLNGAYISKLPGYITRQTHDIEVIRSLGTKEESFKKWYQFVYPLLDAKTFKGFNPQSFLRKVHENLYAGVHHLASDDAEIDAFSVFGSMAKKASSPRVLHFKDAESAYQYNQTFGTKHLRDSVLTDIRLRTRNIALMEAFGPNPKHTFEQIKRDLLAEARDHKDSAKQVDSLKSWRIDAAFKELSGENDVPGNVTLSRTVSTIRALAQMSKLGGVLLSSIGDKAFLQSEMAFQGVSQIQTLARQITGLGPRNATEKQKLRLMGVALDGLMGNVAHRYTMHTNTAGWAARAQQRFYDLSGMNWWNDVNKATAGELMAAHLGEHAELMYGDLPEEITRVLRWYDINEAEWDAVRGTAYDMPERGVKYLTPDQFQNMDSVALDQLVEARGLALSDANRRRVLDEVEKKFRTYFADRVDYAVPTPGIAQRKYTHFNTQAGTPLGEAIRLLMMFKNFPITIMSKIMAREVYGRGSRNIKQWLAHDHKGKFMLAQLIAMTTIGGYVSGTIKDVLRNKTPRPLVKDGQINWEVVNWAFLRGGGAGIMGDVLFQDYDRSYSSFLGIMAGPVVGQLDPMADIYSRAVRGEEFKGQAGKFLMDNTPYINLFYIRPVLDYFVLWNMQEMIQPGYMDRIEDSMEEQGQEFIIEP